MNEKYETVADIIEDRDRLRGLLREARKYVQSERDEAECRHDSDGEFYMDGGMYEIMREGDALLARIDAALAGAADQPAAVQCNRILFGGECNCPICAADNGNAK